MSSKVGPADVEQNRPGSMLSKVGLVDVEQNRSGSMLSKVGPHRPMSNGIDLGLCRSK